MLYDFHTHTTLSDGELSPIELIRRALVKEYHAIALTDHASTGSLERIINEVCEECALARSRWNILAFPGVELTHVPAPAIAEVAKKAKQMGAWVVVVHGETVVEPVEKGTNTAALKCPDVDILAHPGLLTIEEARLAAANNIFLEITTRRGHCLTNGIVAVLAKQAGAKLLLNTDTHSIDDLLSPSLAKSTLLGAGLNESDCEQVLETNSRLLVDRLTKTYLK